MFHALGGSAPSSAIPSPRLTVPSIAVRRSLYIGAGYQSMTQGTRTMVQCHNDTSSVSQWHRSSVKMTLNSVIMAPRFMYNQPLSSWHGLCLLRFQKLGAWCIEQITLELLCLSFQSTQVSCLKPLLHKYQMVKNIVPL